jgi:transposase
MDFGNFNRRTDDDLRSISPVLRTLVNNLESLNHEIREIDRIIEETIKTSPSASLLYTIPSVGYYGALAIDSEIGDISRFPSEDNIFSYAGMVPRIHQS